MTRSENMRRINADPEISARRRAASRAAVVAYWSTRKLPPMTAKQLWKYKLIRRDFGRETALKVVLA